MSYLFLSCTEILPASGEYEIRVLQPRSQARKDKKPQYWMSINIK